MDPPITLAEGAAMASALLKRKSAKKSKGPDPARELRAALEHVRALDLPKYMPVMNYALVSGAILRATDLYSELEIAIPDLGGSGLLPIVDVLMALKGASGAVTWDGARQLTMGSTSVQLLAPPLVEDYPAMSWGAAIEEPPPVASPAPPWKARESHVHTVDAAELFTKIAAVEHASSADETRPHLNGLLIVFRSGDHVDCAATDGHRLAVTDMSSEQERERVTTLILPRSTLALLSRFSRGSDRLHMRWAWFDRKHVGFGETLGRVEISGAGWRLRAKPVDGHFPPYEKVIPGPGTMRWDLPRGAITAALEALSAAPQGRCGGSRLEVSEDGSTLVMSLESPDSGTITHRVPVQPTGERFVIGVNAGYLLDATRSITGDAVVIDVGYSKDKAIDPIRVWSPAAPLDMRVVMPCRM